KLLADCKTDVGGTLAFLSGNGIPTSAFVTGLNQVVDSQKPDASTSAVLKSVIASTIPATYNAGTLLKAAAQATTGQFQFSLPAGVPTSAQQSLTVALIGTFALGFPGFTQQAFAQAASANDATLTQEGDQLEQDIKDTLKTNLAPFTVDADKIVNDASK
ncbi:MAG: hypothetical protein H0X24_16815, partial [Ktedonobacterales bacterium]|nr:hypothetical protein [Ktedonobacterales bacterium]